MRYANDTVQTKSDRNGLRAFVLAAVLVWNAEPGYAQQSQEMKAVQSPVIEEATGDESVDSVAADELTEQEQMSGDAAAGRVDDPTTMASESQEAPSELAEQETAAQSVMQEEPADSVAEDGVSTTAAQEQKVVDEAVGHSDTPVPESEDGTQTLVEQEEPGEPMTQDEPAVGAETVPEEDVNELLDKAKAAFDVSDLISAMSLYRKAAELGNAEAQTRLGYLLDQAEQDQEAAEWLEKAATQGYAEAAYYLASMYVASTESTQNFDRAVELFESAAQQGHSPSIRVLAGAYETGDMQLIRNYDKAAAWLRAGVEAGDVWSIQRLSRAYRNGDLGLRIDEEKADELERMVVQQRVQTE